MKNVVVIGPSLLSALEMLSFLVASNFGWKPIISLHVCVTHTGLPILSLVLLGRRLKHFALDLLSCAWMITRCCDGLWPCYRHLFKE